MDQPIKLYQARWLNKWVFDCKVTGSNPETWLFAREREWVMFSVNQLVSLNMAQSCSVVPHYSRWQWLYRAAARYECVWLDSIKGLEMFHLHFDLSSWLKKHKNSLLKQFSTAAKNNFKKWSSRGPDILSFRPHLHLVLMISVMLILPAL